ncbi:MgtC/SapB family protein [Roseiterribacter gracilis]|uniref:Protein MgtC n=1 Tax=Roseiterribacter gracilis TaxID=2812848 RepID=A0A8S8XG56_9PROT|nr:methyltransferase [Rhodospirillales bacterium TMPK1]
MHAANIDLGNFWLTASAILFAFVMGLLIGIERQWRQRTGGMRSNVLVAVAAAAFADLGFRLRGVEGATQIVAYVVSGIGFLGAGVIVKEGTNIRGLNTAATLWGTAAVGALCGCRLVAEAALLTGVVLAGNTLLRPLVNWINRRPLHEAMVEAHYRIHAVCPPSSVPAVRSLLHGMLRAHHFPIRKIETLSESDEAIELAAEIVPHAAEATELDDVVAKLERAPEIMSASWSVSTVS